MSQSSLPNAMQQNSSSSAAETIGHSIDILTQILLPLPAKPLTNFKLVSKQWLSMISRPHFLSRYTVLHPPLLSGLFLVPKDRNKFNEDQIQHICLNQNRSNYAPVCPPFKLQECQGFTIV
uniref:F-box domain-containing protein n=1 Tax=Opuntia streptacantha TaxID=393608 RepID=A0A7C9CU39_OPUST